MNESTTRKELIDVQLKEAGWDVTDLSQVVEEYTVNLNSENQVKEPTEKYWGAEIAILNK